MNAHETKIFQNIESQSLMILRMMALKPPLARYKIQGIITSLLLSCIANQIANKIEALLSMFDCVHYKSIWKDIMLLSASL